jgi:hypothetical protein
VTRRSAAAEAAAEAASLKRVTMRRRGRRTCVLSERMSALLRNASGKDAAAAKSVVKGTRSGGSLWAGVRTRI